MTALFMVSGVIRSAQRSICPRTVSVCHVITLETTSGPRTRCMTSLYHQSVGTGCVVIETETSGVWYIRYGAQYYLDVRQFLYAIYDDIFLLIKTIVNFFLYLDLNARQNESYLSYYDAKIITLTCVLNIIQIWTDNNFPYNRLSCDICQHTHWVESW